MKASSNLRREIGWVISGLVGVFLISFALGAPGIGVFLYLSSYVGWLLIRMHSLVKWLDAGAKPSEAPPTTGLASDIVQLVHREKKYSRKQKNRYRSTLAQFNSLASDLPDATVVLSEDNEIRWANAAAQTLLNIHPDKDKGQRIDNLIRVPEFREFLHADDGAEELEISGPVALEKVLAVRKVRTGKHMKVLIAADITQRVQVREMRKAFVADVSHELRTPLTVIRGYLEMLRDEPTLDDDAIQSLDQITAQSDRMRGIVEDLLRLSKLEGNLLGSGEGSVVNVANLIESMISPLEEISDSHRVSVDLNRSLQLMGSESELYSAFNNLLTNAVRYTDAGTQIDVSWQINADGSASYSVTDNGPGIEARHLSRLSERFYRVDAGRSRDQGGTGLGLAIVKHAAQRHGGVLDIKSTPGTGSTFTITFPATRSITFDVAANQ